MKQLFFTVMISIAFAAYSQANKDSLPVNKDKEIFYKNYSGYLVRSKSIKPKISIDSSLFLPAIKQAPAPVVKTNLRSKEIKGEIVPGKKSVEIIPSVPVVEVANKDIVERKAVAADEPKTGQPVRFIFSAGKQALPKITVDSSVYMVPKKEIVQSPTIKTNLKAQQITGIVLPGKKSVTIEPVEEKKSSAVNANTMFKREPPVMKTTVAVVDSSIYLPKPKQMPPHPTVKTDLVAQEINGTVVPGKTGVLIQPQPVAPQKINVSLKKSNNLPKENIPVQKTGEPGAKKQNPLNTYSNPVDATRGNSILKNTIDPLTSYTLPGDDYNSQLKKDTVVPGIMPEDDPLRRYTTPPLNLKAQFINNGVTYIAQKGHPVVIEPISPDSLQVIASERGGYNDTLNSRVQGFSKTNIIQAIPGVDSNKNRVTVVNSYSSAPVQGIHYTFYLSRNGTYTIQFTNNKYRVSVNETGKVSEYVMLPTIEGSVANAAEAIPVSYNNDSTINKIGKLEVRYNYNKLISKVGDCNIYYNGSGLVEEICKTGIWYTIDNTVKKIDPNNGLIIYKPE